MLAESKLKILYVSDDMFPPFRVDVVTLFGKEIVGRGHKIDWVLQSDGPCKKSYEIDWHGGTAFVGSTDKGNSRYSRFKKHTLAIKHQFKIFSLAKNTQYDFIQVKNKYVASLIALLASKIYRKKFIFWLSFPFPEESLYKVKKGVARYPLIYFVRGHLLRFLQYKIIMPLADHVFVQSSQMKEDIIAQGIECNKLTPVPMGVSLNTFDEYRDINIKTIENNNIKKNILYLGTLDRARKIDFLVRVFGLVLDKYPDVVFYIVGDGNEPNDRKVLEEQACKLGIADKMIITGFMPRKEAMEYVNKADVCFSPYCPSFILNSTSPTKLVEYMAMEKAVVANEHPEQKLVLNESGGGYCVPYDEFAFADATIKLLNDPKKAKEMGVSGRKYIEKYRDYGVIAKNLECEYYKVLNRK